MDYELQVRGTNEPDATPFVTGEALTVKGGLLAR